eukprot:gene36493-biopygen7420
MDSYDHLYRECPGENLCRARTLGTVALKEKWQELPPGERTLAQLLLELYKEPDGYRVALGDITRRQKHRLRAAYIGLERPTDRDADTTFLRHMRRRNHLREAIWEERRHMLDPSARSWSEEPPKGSKWFVVYRGHACGVHADYDLAKAQIFQVPGGKLRRFPDEAAGAAEHLRLALELQRQRDRVHAEGTALISVYTDGSYSKAEPSLHTPSKAGWALLAVLPTDDRVLCQRNNFLMLDPDDLHYHGATHKSNNTGEVTAIGEALAWIHQQPTDPAISYEICSDSHYGIGAVDGMPGRESSRIRNGRLIQLAYDQLALSRGAGSIVQFRMVKAHQTDNSRDSRRNRDADKLAGQGRLMDLTEFSLRLDEEEMAVQLFRYPQDWEDLSDSPAPASCHDNAPHLPLGPENHCASIAVYNHPVTPMLTATQPQPAPLQTWARVSRPGPPCGSTSHPASRDPPPQPDSGACAPRSGERPGLPPTTRVPPDPEQHRLQMSLTAHPPAPDAEADKSDTGTACDRPGLPDPDRPGTQDTKNRVRAVTWADRVHPDNTHTGPV